MDVQRAYSALTIKAIDSGRRTFSGIATDPSPDRVGDTINPLGASFTNPVILLRMHRHDEPIGRVFLKKPTAKGIEFEAEIPVVGTPGAFKDRVDMAWDELSHLVVRAVSIGFKPLKYAYKEDGGVDFQELEIYELSTVSVGALPSAIITSVKSLNGAPLPRNVVDLIRAAEGRKTNTVKLLDPRQRGVKLIR